MSALANIPKPIRTCPSTRKYLKSLERRSKPKVHSKEAIARLKYWSECVHGHPKVLFFGFSGMGCQEMEELRYNLKAHGLKVTHVKTAPTQYAIKSSPLHGSKGLHQHLKDQMCVAYSDELEIDMKSIVKVLKSSPNAKFLGGLIDYTAMMPEDIDEYAKLPSLQKSREELVGILSQPSQTLLRLLQTNQSNLTQALSLYIQQNEPKGSDGGAEGGDGA